MRLLPLASLALSVCVAPVALAQSSDDVEAASERASQGLLADLERIVRAEQSAGWFLDDDAYRSVHEHLMESVCRTPTEARKLALAAARDQALDSGDARVLFDQAGRELDSAARQALTAERSLRALEQALTAADSECPFWVAVDDHFQGLQTDRNRLTLAVETGGMVQLRRTEGRWTYGGGGYGRVLPAWGFGGRFTLLAGFEFGGGAMLQPGTDPPQFVINYFPAIPVVLRFRNVAWHYDLELAPVALFQQNDTSISYGWRVGGVVGLSALRTQGVIPWAGVAMAYEQYPANGGRPFAHFLRGGLRVGFQWDP